MNDQTGYENGESLFWRQTHLYYVRACIFKANLSREDEILPVVWPLVM